MKNIFTFLALFILNSSSALSLDLSTAAICDGNPSSKSQAALDAGKIISEVYKNNDMRVGRCLGWTNLNEGNIWYDFTSKMQVYSIDLDSKKLLGHWSLTPDESCPANQVCKSVWWQGRWREEELLEPLLTQRLTDMFGNLAFSNNYVADGHRTILDTMGCMQHTPLRYGDIDGDGINEVVVLLAQGYSIDWLIFSPAKQKTIFVSKLNIDDSIITSQAPSELMPWHEDSKRYQYWMQTQVNNGSPLYRPGLKAYAKLYFNDFDGDGAFDILVWRKMYESRLVGDPVAGYELKGELLGHYELVEGEYRLQATNAETVKGWLTESQQSWSMGYPRESECSGQEGQLIPEVHDPILNDPEVLETVPTSEPTPTPRDE